MSDLEDDLSIDINLRPAQEVGERMLILAALIRIALVETEDDDEIDPRDAAAELADLRDALQIGQWASTLTPEERDFLLRAGGRLTETDLLAMIWRLEALAALSWATYGPAELPPIWQLADPSAIIGSIPAPWEDVDEFIKQLDLRTDEEIAEERERAELWAWRSAIEVDLEFASGRERTELLETLRETVAEAADARLLIGGRNDFLVDGRPFSSADPETKALIAEISLQRLHALNWIAGYGDSWDDVPLDL
jgi:hypothetical protein